MREYLLTKILTTELLLKLIQILSILKKISSEQGDLDKKNLYLLPSGQLKVKEVDKSAWRDRTYLYPRKLLIGLATKQATLVLAFVEKMASELYNEWKQSHDMHSLACYMYGGISQKKLQNPFTIQSNNTLKQTYFVPTGKNQKNVVVLFSKR
ncbi:hypothetical protein ABE137_14410 [Brevibacillus laterosporus]|uniref:hypothetical protein n=1 Tax=Brevibacillus laterosporus TaxID=1465 RepID=UPI003D210C3C